MSDLKAAMAKANSSFRPFREAIKVIDGVSEAMDELEKANAIIDESVRVKKTLASTKKQLKSAEEKYASLLESAASQEIENKRVAQEAMDKSAKLLKDANSSSKSMIAAAQTKADGIANSAISQMKIANDKTAFSIEQHLKGESKIIENAKKIESQNAKIGENRTVLKGLAEALSRL